VTMALIENPSPAKYGGVAVSDDGWVTGFGARGSGDGTGQFHFIGVQVADAQAFADLDDGVPAESVNMLYRRLIAANPRAIAAHVSTASFLDIGTPRDYLETTLALADAEGAHLIGNSARIDSSAMLARTVLWDDVTVGSEARLYDCVVADGAHIPDGASFSRCAIVAAAGRPPRADERVEGRLLIRDLEGR
jgi:NDP-sugar pyrophosphorylase family protein